MGEKKRDGLKRAATVAGKGGKHIANFIGKWVIMPAIVVAAIAYFAIPYLSQQIKETITGPNLPPKVQLDQANRKCALVAAYHDGYRKQERLGAAMAHINLAKALGLTTAEVYDGFLTLVIPGGSVISIRSCTADYWGYGWSQAQKAKWSVGVTALDECLADQEKCFKEHPWLACVKYEIRNTWRGATPTPDYRLRTDPRVVRVYPVGKPAPDDAEFYCDKADRP